MNENKFIVEDDEIDLGALLKTLWSKLWLIILVGILFAGGAFVYTMNLVTPMYSSNTSMYILSRQSSEVLTSSDLSLSNYLVADYAEIIQSRTVAQAVIDEMGLPYTAEQMLSKISVDVADNARVITIYVIDPDPAEAQAEANCVRDMAAEHIMNVMSIDAVNVVDEANLPYSPYNIHTFRNVLMGGFLGCFLICFIIALRWFLNDTIKTTEDMEKYLGISTLGVIPMSEADRKNSKKAKQWARKHYKYKKR